MLRLCPILTEDDEDGHAELREQELFKISVLGKQPNHRLRLFASLRQTAPVVFPSHKSEASLLFVSVR